MVRDLGSAGDRLREAAREAVMKLIDVDGDVWLREGDVWRLAGTSMVLTLDAVEAAFGPVLVIRG